MSSNPDKIETQLQWLEVVTDVSIEVCPETGRAQLMLVKLPIKAICMVGQIEGEDEEEDG